MRINSDFSIPSSDTFFTGKDSFTDEILWSNLKNGNELALSMIYKKYVQRLYDYGMHTCRNHDLVKDCIQELFLRLWSKRAGLGDVQLVKAYLFKSFRRQLIAQIIERRKNSAPLPESDVAFEFTPSIEAILIEDELKEEQIIRLRNCILSLTKGQREIIYLKFYNDLNYQEISEITELQVDSIYNLVSKTIELLRRKLQISKPHIPLL